MNPQLIIKTTLREILENIRTQAKFNADYQGDRGRIISMIDYYLNLIDENKIKLKTMR